MNRTSIKHLMLCLAAVLAMRTQIGQAQNSNSSHGTVMHNLTKLPNYLLYVGTYTDAKMKSKGIYTVHMDSKTGALSSLEVAAETPNPTFLDFDLQRHCLYAANEVGHFEGEAAGFVTAFAIEPGTGKLRELNKRSSGGDGPCHILLDEKGKNALTANYGGGSVEVLPVMESGELGVRTAFIHHTGSSVNASRQEKAHAHSVTLDAANKFAFVCDLGMDKIVIYRFDPAQGTLKVNEPAAFSAKPGNGPRHMAFHPNGRFAYVINELSSSVTAMSYDAAHGALEELQEISTLPGDFKGENTDAEIAMHPSGKFLYGSCRGHDSIAVFAVDPENGKLTSVEHQSTQGKTPRYFGIDPTGRFIVAANQDSNNLVVFAIDQSTGKLKATGSTLGVPAPVCIKFMPMP